MDKCLLCQTPITGRQTFSEILFFKETKPSICTKCRDDFQPIPKEHCPRCYKPNTNEVCLDCQYWNKQNQEVSHESLFLYNDAMAAYFSRYKFEGDYLLRYALAKELSAYLQSRADYTIIPIPISTERMAERGFNQVTGLLEASRIPYQSLLTKSDTKKQSEKTRRERLQTAQSFSLATTEVLPDKILLVDDIYTTGATLLHAKNLLMKNGAKEIKTFSLAR